jgi:hypothetical protein
MVRRSRRAAAVDPAAAARGRGGRVRPGGAARRRRRPVRTLFGVFCDPAETWGERGGELHVLAAVFAGVLQRKRRTARSRRAIG